MKKYIAIILLFGLFSLLNWNCELFETDDPDDDPVGEQVYTQLTSENLASEYAGCYNPADGKIYYRSNVSSITNETYDIWRMNTDGSAQEKVLSFNFGWGAKVGGGFSILDNRLSFYEATSLHEMLSLDLSLSDSFPLNRSSSNNTSYGVFVILAVPGGMGGAFVDYHVGLRKAAWMIRTSQNGVNPAIMELRIGDDPNINNGLASSAGEMLITGRVVAEQHDFSPDGDQIVISYVPTGSGDEVKNDIYTIARSNGAIHTRLTNEGDNGITFRHPSWSPDGKLIAFDRRDIDGNIQVYTIKPDGTDLTQVTAMDGEIGGMNGIYSWGEPIWIDNNTLIISKYNSDHRQIWTVTL